MRPVESFDTAGQGGQRDKEWVAMLPVINWAKQVAFEGNVSIPKISSSRADSYDRAYDLALFEDRANKQALVLLVTIIMDFDFRDGDFGNGTWIDTDKRTFVDNLKAACEEAWSNQHLITPMYCADDLVWSEARVVILIKTAEGALSYFKSHWTVTVRKVEEPVQNYIKDKNDVRFESTGLDPSVPDGGIKKRRSIVHEFGHMLGYADEYPRSGRGINFYISESDSIMHLGDVVKDRHYVFFADWISNKLGGPWAVEGRRTLKNTLL